MRPLLALLIIILTLSASGITSAIASTTSETEEDCCAGGANDSPTDSPTEERDDCPPLCHACACSPTFAIPNIAVPGAFVAIRDRNVHRELSSQLPVGPPGRGVFHPPRVSI